jgi:predicted nucleic acid-binding protein
MVELVPKLSDQQRREFARIVELVVHCADRVELAGDFHLCRDPQDDTYLETCQTGRAHYLVTRDPDLLVLRTEDLKRHRLGRLRIVTPQGFLLDIGSPTAGRRRAGS